MTSSPLPRPKAGAKVSWESKITGKRHFGTYVKTVEVDGVRKFRVRTKVGRAPLDLPPARVTFEVG